MSLAASGEEPVLWFLCPIELVGGRGGRIRGLEGKEM